MFELSLQGDISLWWPGLLILGFCIGNLSGLFGVGGGFILTPFLVILFMLPEKYAVGSGLLMIFVNSCLSTWRHNKKRNVDFKLGLLMAVGMVCGTEVGKRLMEMLGDAGAVTFNGREIEVLFLVFRGLYLIALTSVALLVWSNTRKNAQEAEETPGTALSRRLQSKRWLPCVRLQRCEIENLSVWIPILSTIFVGILSGMLGFGGGFVLFPMLVFMIGAPTGAAVGTGALVVLFGSGFGAMRYYSDGFVLLPLVGILLAASLFGTISGGWLHDRLGGKKLKKYFALVVIFGAMVVLWDLLYGLFGPPKVAKEIQAEQVEAALELPAHTD